MRRTSVTKIPTILLVALLLSGCLFGPGYDVDQFEHIREYTREISPPIMETVRLLEDWIQGARSLEIDELAAEAQRILAIEAEYRNDAWPTREEIENWEFTERRGVWVVRSIEGRELADALDEMSTMINELHNVSDELGNITEALETDLDTLRQNVPPGQLDPISDQMRRIREIIATLEEIMAIA